MGDCPELFNRLFGGSSNLTNDWATKLYHIVQYEFLNRAVSRKITDMLLDLEDQHPLYREIIRDHYRFMNPELELDAEELKAIEGRVAEFYDILMAVKAKLLGAANSGMERYVRRGAAGTTLRNNNEGNNNEGNNSNSNNADRLKTIFDEYQDLPRDGDIDTIKDTRGKYEELIGYGRSVLGPTNSHVAHAMLIYADISATLMRKTGSSSAEVAKLFEEAADAASKSDDKTLYIAALNMYGGFMSSFGSKPYKDKGWQTYGLAYKEAKKHMAVDDPTRQIVSLNYVNALTNFAVMFDPSKLGLADLVMTQILNSMSPDDPFRERFLGRQIDIKVRLAEPATEAKLRQIIDIASDSIGKVESAELKKYFREQILRATKTLYTMILATSRKDKYEEAIALFEHVKTIITDPGEIQMLDALIIRVRAAGEQTKAALKVKLKAATGRRG